MTHSINPNARPSTPTTFSSGEVSTPTTPATEKQGATAGQSVSMAPKVNSLNQPGSTSKPDIEKPIGNPAKIQSSDAAIETKLGDFEKLVRACLALISKNNEQELATRGALLKGNESILSMKKESAKLQYDAEKTQAIGQIIGGAISVGGGVISGGYAAGSIRSSSTISPEARQSVSAAMNSAFGGISQMATGVANSMAASDTRDSRVRAAEAEFAQANQDAIHTNLAAISRSTEALREVIVASGSLSMSASRA